MPIKAVAFLQNVWVKDPEKFRYLIKRHGEEFRRRALTYALFAGCLTGKRIKRAFGDSTDIIAWDEASRHIGDKASSKFPADLDHIHDVITFYKPELVITFGTVATNAVYKVWAGKVISGPHPAARLKTTIPELTRMAREFNDAIPYYS